MAAQAPAHRDPSRTIRPYPRVAQGFRKPDCHWLRHRPDDLGSRPTRMEPDRLAEVTDPVVREVVRDEVLAERDGLGLAQLRACARCSSTCRTASSSACERTCPHGTA